MRIRLLGGFEVSEGDRTIAPGAWRLRKAKTLIKLLALEPTHRLHRDQLADLLWPDVDGEAARNNLHQVLHAARRALSTVGLDGATSLALQDSLVVLGPDGEVVTDVEEFQDAVERATASRDSRSLTATLKWGSAELLPEDAYEPWAHAHANRIREWRTRVLLGLVEDHLGEHEPQAALALLAPEVAANPMHEPLHRAMMRALAEAGRHAEALVLFERLRTVLQDELAAEPDSQTRQLYRELLAGRAQDAKPRRAPVTNLPARMGALLGRHRELDEIGRLLGNSRLLTLTGPGGAGKTTLAIELARTHINHYRDGVSLVELGAVSDGDLVVEAVAAALGLQLPSRDAPLDSLVAQLHDRELLIVLDNCEHLIDACARVVTELLQGCAAISVLATSREPLRIEGEVTWRTPSLALPDPGDLPTLEVLATVASVQLFLQRAQAVSPGFALTGDNATAVAEICYRLDGMPLALELAAACIPMFTPQQIAARLGDALELLSRGRRDAITRQQTLSATLAWSHDLLSAKEQVLLRRLAVFAGSFTVEAVEHVGANGPGQAQTFGALGRLVDTSLVLAETRGEVIRYRLLETVRQYAREKLRAAGEESMVRERHCAWYVEFCEARDPEVAASAVVVPASLDVEHDNLRSALAWALPNEPLMAMRLAVALWRYWMARGLFAEGRRWLEAVLAAVAQPSAMRTRALLALAVFDVRRGTAERLAEIGAEAVAAHRGTGTGTDLALTLHEDGVLAYMRGRWTESWQRSLEARRAARGPAAEVEAASANLQALVLLGRGQFGAAREAFQQTQAALADVVSWRPFFRTLMLGWVVEGARTKPRLYFEETVLPGPHVAADHAHGYVLCNLAYLARLTGDLDEARRLVEDSIAVFTALGDRDGESLALNHLGCLHRVRGEYAPGRAALEASLRLRHQIGDRRATGLTLGNLGVLTAAEGGTAAGLALLRQALAGFEETEDAPGRVAASLTMASVHAEAGDYDRVQRLLPGALVESRQIPGNHRATAWGYLMLGDVQRRLGQVDDAARSSASADELFQELGATQVGAAKAPIKAR